MSRVLKGIAVAVVAAGSLALVGNAAAAEIARPIVYSIPYSGKPAGPKVGSIRAETRGGREAGYLILDEKLRRDETWVAIRVGKRPNDRVGWVEAEDIDRIDARYKVHISLSAKEMVLFKDRKRVWATRVVIGDPATPTPKGLFAIHDFYRVHNELKPWQIELTAHSEVHKTFQGGPGRVAIHGRHGSLAVPWGTMASNGCIRSPDWALRSIRKLAPVGTPVVVR